MNISIYVYKFPPDTDVGGRRWGLFVTQLATQGHKIAVTTTNAQEKRKYWASSHPDLPISFREMPTTWFATNSSRDLTSRVRWHIEQQILQFLHAGRIYDKTIAQSKVLEKYVTQDCDHNIDVIIVSCAPFRWSLHIGETLARFKKRPKYFIDLRDPWSRNRLSYFNNLSSKRLTEESLIEEQAVGSADGIIVTHEAMLKHYPKKQTVYIPNNIEVPEGTWPLLRIEKTLKLIFPGTLYKGGESLLIRFLQLTKEANPEKRIQLTLLGNWKSSLIHRIESTCEVDYLGIVPREEVAPLIRQHHYVLSYVSKKLPYAINTKALEAVENRTPIIFLGENAFQNFIVENNIGWEFKASMSKNDLAEKFTSATKFGPFVQKEFSRQHSIKMLLDFIQNGTKNQLEP